MGPRPGRQRRRPAGACAQWPQVPDSLVELLSRVDGTHFREYPGGEVCVLMLGSDVEDGGYPYYLRSAAQIFEDQRQWDDKHPFHL